MVNPMNTLNWINEKYSPQVMANLILLSSLDYSFDENMAPDTVVFSNRHGRVLGKAQLSEEFRIPKGTRKVRISRK